MVRDDIEKALTQALEKLGASGAQFSVEYPPQEAKADYASNAALVAAKALARSPREIAEALARELHGAVPNVERIDVAGPGFLNFTVARGYFAQTLQEIARQGEAWGSNTQRQRERVMVEHTQPNPFKPFHIGHLMSNTIGESIARLMRASGALVTAVNYQGDVGLHVAKALWGLQQKKLDPTNVAQIGEAYVYGNVQYEENEQAKAEIQDLNKKVYAQAPEIMPMYTAGREASLKHFEEIYALLGSTFEHYFFEGDVWKEGAALVEEGLQKQLFEQSDGAIVFRGERVGLHTRVFITREGLPTYEAKELGLAVAKARFKPFDLSITTTAVEQEPYFNVVFEALGSLRPDLKGKFKHVPHGMMLLSSGKMSSRKGNIVTGESLLHDMIEASQEKMQGREVVNKEQIAQKVGVAAIKYAVLKQSTGKNSVFDPEKSLSFEGDSGPYIQYAHTRARSILRKAAEEGVTPDALSPTETAPEIERLLPRFPEVVRRAAELYEPHYVAQYAVVLAGAFNQWYAKERVLDGTKEAGYKLALVEAVAQTLKNSLQLLGIEAPQEM